MEQRGGVLVTAAATHKISATLQDTVEQYQADVAAGRRTRSATYELAMAHAAQTGQAVRKGDRITYYITGSGSGVTAFANACLAEVWEAEHPDENTDFYLKRLDEFARKFAPFFTPEDFQQVFAPEGLFGFSAAGIRLQTTIKQEQSVRQKGETPWDVSTARSL
jgi:DNA polymerase, archaea type